MQRVLDPVCKVLGQTRSGLDLILPLQYPPGRCTAVKLARLGEISLSHQRSMKSGLSAMKLEGVSLLARLMERKTRMPITTLFIEHLCLQHIQTGWTFNPLGLSGLNKLPFQRARRGQDQASRLRLHERVSRRARVRQLADMVQTAVDSLLLPRQMYRSGRSMLWKGRWRRKGLTVWK